MKQSVVLGLLLLLCSTFVFVRADDNEGPSDRAIDINVEGDQVEIEARGVAVGEETDRYKITFKTDSGDSNLLEAELEWSVHAPEGNDSANRRREDDEQSVEFRFRLSYLAEYVESGANAGFQPNEDTVVSTYGGDEFSDKKRVTIPNTQAEWNDFKRNADKTSGTATIYSFQASTSDAVLTIKGYIATEPTTSGGVELDPNQVKLDILVSNYPFQQDDTYLALVARVKADADFESDDDDSNDEDHLQVKPATATTAFGGFGWLNTLTVDGVETAVVSSTGKESEDSEGSEYYTYFAFPAHGTDYVWDPNFMVQYSSSSGDGGSANAVSSFLMNLF